jgi:ATP-dependent DNA helicase RecG
MVIERTMTIGELVHLASQKESHRKAADISGKKVQKIAVAFANADGGEFIIGVADDKGAPEPEKAWRGAWIQIGQR